MVGYFISNYILNRQPDRENKMRYNEANVQPTKGKAKKEKDNRLPSAGKYTSKDLEGGKPLPMKGGNYNG